MSDTSSQDEPTMEEILASIRKIISDDGEDGEQAAEAETGKESDVQDDDVLELTERVEDEPGSEEENTIEDRIDSILADSGAAPGEGSDGLVSDTTKSGVTSALSSFAGALSQGKGGGSVLPGGPTLDALVLAVLEPQLKSWLDENLEPLVERLVKEELKRMARRAEDL